MGNNCIENKFKSFKEKKKKELTWHVPIKTKFAYHQKIYCPTVSLNNILHMFIFILYVYYMFIYILYMYIYIICVYINIYMLYTYLCIYTYLN